MPAAQGRISDNGVMEILNDGKDKLCQRLIEADEGFFETETAETITFVANTETYDLPAILKDAKLTTVELFDTSGNFLRMLEKVSVQRKEITQGISAPARDVVQYYLSGRKIGFKPKPTTAQTDAVKIRGLQHPIDFYWGTTGTPGSTTSFVITGGTTLGGSASTETDYYKNAYVRFLSGTNALGVQRKITAYNANTKTVTLDAVIVIADCTAQTFCIFSPIPDQYHNVLISYAVMQIASTQENDSLFQTHKSLWEDALRVADETIESRSYDGPNRVQLPADLYDDV